MTGATASAIGSHGLSLDIETTALACLAWSSAGAGARTQALDAARYLRSQCQDGRFSTTQATVLALRALLVEQHDRDTKPGTVALTVDGREPLSLHIDPRRLSITDPLIVTLGPGTHTIGITQSEGGRLPWSLHLSGHVARPVSDPACPLRLVTTLSRARLPVGEPLECTVTVINANAAAVRSPIAVIPLPGGVDADPEQLRGLVRAGRIAASEVRDGAVVLYFETLAASETRVVPLALVASVPGSYSAPAARAYAYYQDELKWWCTPLTVEIDARR